MPELIAPRRLAQLLEPYLQQAPAELPGDLLPQLTSYLDLLVRWNSRTNLTAVRDPEKIVTRHFGESLFAASHLESSGSLLDLGSGAGFPGVPIQLVWPRRRVMLAESQGKKASFLREVKRVLNLEFEIWPARAETLPAGRLFQTVALRADDHMPEALAVAAARSAGQLCILSGADQHEEIRSLLPGFTFQSYPVPEALTRTLLLGHRLAES